MPLVNPSALGYGLAALRIFMGIVFFANRFTKVTCERVVDIGCYLGVLISRAVEACLNGVDVRTLRGTTWTTDAPFRETRTALARAEAAGALAVEMEAAALYALSAAQSRPIVCFAHVTNTMAVTEGDFEKGPSDGAEQALAVVAAAALGWQAYRQRDKRRGARPPRSPAGMTGAWFGRDGRPDHDGKGTCPLSWDDDDA